MMFFGPYNTGIIYMYIYVLYFDPSASVIIQVCKDSQTKSEAWSSFQGTSTLGLQIYFEHLVCVCVCVCERRREGGWWMGKRDTRTQT